MQHAGFPNHLRGITPYGIIKESHGPYRRKQIPLPTMTTGRHRVLRVHHDEKIQENSVLIANDVAGLLSWRPCW